MCSPHAWKIEIQLQISDFFGFIDKMEYTFWACGQTQKPIMSMKCVIKLQNIFFLYNI